MIQVMIFKKRKYSISSVHRTTVIINTVDNTSMNPSLFGKTFCLFSREVFELQTSPMPIFASSFQGLSDGQIKFSLRPTQQTLDKT